MCWARPLVGVASVLLNVVLISCGTTKEEAGLDRFVEAQRSSAFCELRLGERQKEVRFWMGPPSKVLGIHQVVDHWASDNSRFVVKYTAGGKLLEAKADGARLRCAPRIAPQIKILAQRGTSAPAGRTRIVLYGLAMPGSRAIATLRAIATSPTSQSMQRSGCAGDYDIERKRLVLDIKVGNTARIAEQRTLSLSPGVYLACARLQPRTQEANINQLRDIAVFRVSR